VRQRFASPAVHFGRERFNMARAAAGCDLAVLNGTHGVTAQVLLAGKPSLHFPIFLEQALVAQNVERLGAGLTATPDTAEAPAYLDRLVGWPGYAAAARGFAERYAFLDPVTQVERLTERLATLVE
jgi:UDP:flavonoid glycosyltransferase YjiC (YdhE family)